MTFHAVGLPKRAESRSISRRKGCAETDSMSLKDPALRHTLIPTIPRTYSKRRESNRSSSNSNDHPTIAAISVSVARAASAVEDNRSQMAPQNAAASTRLNIRAGIEYD